MARKFTDATLRAASLGASSTVQAAGRADRCLRSCKLQILFSLDLFNAGLDIPDLDLGVPPCFTLRDLLSTKVKVSVKPAFVSGPLKQGFFQLFKSSLLVLVRDLKIEGAVRTSDDVQNLLPVAQVVRHGFVIPVAEDLLSATLGIDPGEPERRPKLTQCDPSHLAIQVAGTIVSDNRVDWLDRACCGWVAPMPLLG